MFVITENIMKRPVFNLLIPWNRSHLEKLTGSQLVKKFSAFLWNPKINFHIHTYPSTVPTLSQLDPVQAPTSHFLKIRHNIILPSTNGSSQWPLSLMFPHQNPEYASPLPHTCYMSRPSHSSQFNLPNNIG